MKVVAEIKFAVHTFKTESICPEMCQTDEYGREKIQMSTENDTSL